MKKFNVKSGLSVGSSNVIDVIDNTGSITAANITVSQTANLGNIANIKINGGSSAQVISTDGTGNLSWASPGLNYKYTKEWHVDPVNGNNTTGDGSYNKPYATIAKAISMTGPSYAQVVYLHAGSYSENVTIVSPTENIEIIGVNDTSTSVCSGTWAFSHTGTSIRVMNLRFTGAVSQTSTGAVYFTNCLLSTSFSKSGTGYTEFDNSAVTAVSLTSAATTLFKTGTISGMTINNASATVVAYNLTSAATTTLTAGTCYFFDCALYSATTTTSAFTSSAGTVAGIFRCNVTNSSGTLSRVSLAGFWTINDSTYDLANSTLTGTNLGSVSHFDAVNIRGNVTIQGLLSTTPSTKANNSTGTAGQLAVDADYIYVCTAANTWKRVALSTF